MAMIATAAADPTSPNVGLPLVIGVVVLLIVAVLGAWRGRLGLGWQPVVAVGRAVVQLALVSSVIALVVGRWWTAGMFTLLMFSVAVWTAGGRIDARRSWPWIAVAMGTSVTLVVAIIFGTGASPFTGPAIISIVGIIIGNSMTVVGLAGRRFFEAIETDRGQVEAALALGLPRASAINLVIERRSSLALGPILDQTSTVGLVTLPGAFVGVLLGGGSPAQAAASQLLVLVGILATQVLVVTALRHLVAAGAVLSADAAAAIPAA